jgi:hypothetical protein
MNAQQQRELDRGNNHRRAGQLSKYLSRPAPDAEGEDLSPQEVKAFLASQVPPGTTMGVVHAARFYNRLAKGLKPRRPSVLERIKACQTGAEVHVLMGETLTYEASADTRRKWAELAEERLAAFRSAALSL